MMWHSQNMQTEKPHDDYRHQDKEENFMKEYINRHYDESPLTVLDEPRRDATYSCSNPRMHIKERAQATKLTKDAAERFKEDFENLHGTIDDYLGHY